MNIYKLIMYEYFSLNDAYCFFPNVFKLEALMIVEAYRENGRLNYSFNG